MLGFRSNRATRLDAHVMDHFELLLRRCALLLGAPIATLALGAAPAAYNQTQGAARPAPAPGRSSDGLEPAPVPFEVLGVRFRPPAGSIMRGEGSGRTATWVLSEDVDSPRFILRISKLYADAPSTPAEQVDAYIRSVSERPSSNAVFSVRSRREFRQGDRDAALLYTSLREGEGDSEVSAIQGYFLLQVAPAEFVVISSLVADSDFASVEPLLGRSFATVEVLDPAALEADRSGRMERGQQLLGRLDEAALRKALDPAEGTGAGGRWYRLSRTAPDGAVSEVGYMAVTAVEAAQGAANPDSREPEWTPREREKGLLVRVRMRTLLDPAGKAVSDTDARYWMRWDREREFWTVRSTMRSGKRTARSSAQLGIREPASAGSPRPVLEVTDVDQAKPGAEPNRWQVPPGGYLSQAEAMVLTRLLPPGTEPGRWGFYWFDPRSGRVVQRVDERRPGPDGAEVATRRTLESPEVLDLVDAQGILVRRTADDGAVVERTTAQAMLDLWKRKGLPLE